MRTLIPFILFPIFSFGQTNTFPSTGDVGIGTLSPAGEIHVVANTGSADLIVERSSGTWMKAVAGTLGSGFYYKSTGRLVFSPAVSQNSLFANVENALFFYGPDHPTYPGRLVLGSEFPGDNSKFTVNGRIRSEELKIVNNIEAPDYVFSPSYKLNSLQEVEAFIVKNSHLPEIPSAAEFKENGIIVGEMTFNLLKKVEELTLYLIEMNKTIETLERELESLKEVKK